MTSDIEIDDAFSRELTDEDKLEKYLKEIAEETDQHIREWEDHEFERFGPSRDRDFDIIIKEDSGGRKFVELKQSHSQQDLKRDDQIPSLWKKGRQSKFQEENLRERLTGIEDNIQGIESEIERITSRQKLGTSAINQDLINDKGYIQSKTAIPNVIDDHFRSKIENRLSDSEYIREKTGIGEYLQQEYGLEKTTVQDMTEFKNKSISFHKSNIKVRESWRRTESLGVIILGIGLLVGGSGLYSRGIGLQSFWMNLFVLSSIIVIGSTLIYSGFSGLNKIKD